MLNLNINMNYWDVLKNNFVKTVAHEMTHAAMNDYIISYGDNVSILGGAGNDLFVYNANEGTDRIYDWESGDTLKILNTDGSNGSFKSFKYSGGDLTLTITGGGKVIFDNVSKSDKFKINGTTYKISGTKLVK